MIVRLRGRHPLCAGTANDLIQPERPGRGVADIARHSRELGVENQDPDRGAINRLSAAHCVAVDFEHCLLRFMPHPVLRRLFAGANAI